MLPPLPYQVEPSIMAKAQNIKLAAFDVDGVLTDGKLHYGPDGEQLKVFHALDGHGLKMLQSAGIQVAIISARHSQPLKRRLADLSITECHLGVDNKRSVFDDILNKHQLSLEQCCFVGDDVIDLPVMQDCGLKFSVQNGHFIVRDLADWVAPLMGGNGAVRAICDLLLYAQDAYPLNSSSVQ